jgi:hypothetical protein
VVAVSSRFQFLAPVEYLRLIINRSSSTKTEAPDASYHHHSLFEPKHASSSTTQAGWKLNQKSTAFLPWLWSPDRTATEEC